MPGWTRRRRPRTPGRRHFPVLDAILAAVAANLAVYAGWAQTTLLRLVAALALVVVTAAGVIAHLDRFPAFRRRGPSSLPQEVELPFFCGRVRRTRRLAGQSRSAAFQPTRRRCFKWPCHPGYSRSAWCGQNCSCPAPGASNRRKLPRRPDVPDHGNGWGFAASGHLNSMLRELQWPEEEMRGKDAAELGGIFRAKTADKQMLIVLDGARTPEQVMAVLPGGSQCTVITTSRANLHAGSGKHFGG